MTKSRRLARAFFAWLIGAGVIGALGVPRETALRAVNDTIWVANRGTHTIREFDAATGDEVRTVVMAPGSQPGDLAYAKGKIYVSEEFGTPPAVAIVDVETGVVLSRISFPTGSRPHHVHASVGGNLIAVGLFGTDLVAVIDTHSDTLLGPWDSNPLTATGRVHAGVFSKDGNALYLANEGANEVVAIDPLTGTVSWRMAVPAIHELVVTHDGKYAYGSRRTANKLALINLKTQTFVDILTLGLPDTLRLSANEKLLTVGLRTSPAQLAVVDTESLAYELVNLSPSGGAGSVAGHQWTSPNGRYTFAAFERGTSPGVAVIDHKVGNQVIQTLSYPGALVAPFGGPHGVDRARP
jgi:DNA-binding beta-propeller fold protein YncE